MAENETPLTEQGYSPKELLAQVDKALTAVMVGGQSYKIGSRSLTRANLTELRRLRADLAAGFSLGEVAALAAQVAEEENTGLLGNTSVAFFEGR